MTRVTLAPSTGGSPVASVFGRTGVVTQTSGDYSAAQVTNAADKSSGSQQAFTGEVKAPDFTTSGLTGATAAGRLVGHTTAGAPTTGTFVVGDWITDQAGKRWTCTVAGSPGTWVQEPGTTGPPAELVLSPSGDTTGLTDDQNYYAALATLGTNGGGIVLEPGNYYTIAGWTVPAQKPAGYITATITSGSTAVTTLAAGSTSVPAAAAVVDVYGPGIPAGTRMTMGTPNTTATLTNAAVLGAGAGTKIFIGTTSVTDGNPVSLRGISWPVLFPVGSGGPTGIWCHRWNGDGKCPASSNITYITIDGSLASGQAFGIDWADHQSGAHLIVRVQNFINGTSGNAHGAHLSNRRFFTEKTYIWINATNCDNHIFVTYNGSLGGDSSWEYNTMFFHCISQAMNQNGVVINNVSLGGCEVHIKGNMPSTTAASGAPANNAGTGTPTAALTFITGSSTTQLFYGTLIMKLERDAAIGVPGNVFPWTVYGDASAKVIMSNGRICTGLNGIKWLGPEFTFGGMIGGNDYTGTPGDLAYTTGIPASNAAYKNVGPDAIARFTGGTITNLAYQGMPFFTSGGGWFPLAAGASFTPTYTGTPTLTIVPARVGDT